MSKNVLTGWKYAGFIGAIVATIGVATYPIIIRYVSSSIYCQIHAVYLYSSPYLYPEKWKKMSKEIRDEAGIKQENIQPGNMKVWSDPFDRPGKPGNK